MVTGYAILILYFAIMIALGIFSFLKIKNSNDFYTAGKKGGTLFVSGSLLATILGSSVILGTVDLGFKNGFASAWWIICAIIGLAVLSLFADRVRKLGKYTLPQMIEDFYGKEAGIISSVIIPVAWVGVVTAQIIGASKIMVSFFGMSYSSGVFASGIIFILYTMLGGQVSILRTDFIQILLILAGVAVTFFYAFTSEIHLTANLTNMGFPFNETFNAFDLVVLILTLSTAYFVGPDIYSRLFCARDGKTARRSVIIVMLALIPFAFILSYLGVFAKANFSDAIQHSSALINVAFAVLPQWALGLMAAALLSAVMSSADTTLLTASAILSGLFYEMDGKRSINITRIFILVLGLVSIIFSLYITSIIDALLLALTMFSGAFIIPTAAGLLNYRSAKGRVISAMISGGIIALTGKLISLNTNIAGRELTGNLIIIGSFFINALILFFPVTYRKIFHLIKKHY